jgi:hypothetical protein
MNANYFRSLACEELCETLMWGDLVDDFGTFRSKEKDKKEQTFYRLSMKNGTVLVYSPKSIFIDGQKLTSVAAAKVYLQKNYIA